jgi:hypothetical protein
LLLVKRSGIHLRGRMRTYVECVNFVLPSIFVWLVYGSLSIEKPHIQVRAKGQRSIGSE